MVDVSCQVKMLICIEGDTLPMHQNVSATPESLLLLQEHDLTNEEYTLLPP